MVIYIVQLVESTPHAWFFKNDAGGDAEKEIWNFSFKNFKSLVEARKRKKIACLPTNQGGEFNSKEFSEFCLSGGIKRQ